MTIKMKKEFGLYIDSRESILHQFFDVVTTTIYKKLEVISLMMKENNIVKFSCGKYVMKLHPSFTI